MSEINLPTASDMLTVVTLNNMLLQEEFENAAMKKLAESLQGIQDRAKGESRSFIRKGVMVTLERKYLHCSLKKLDIKLRELGYSVEYTNFGNTTDSYVKPVITVYWEY